MAIANLNPFEKVAYGGVTATDAQVFDGLCSQDRVDVAAVATGYNATPNLTVEGATRFVQVVADAKIRVYAGKPTTDAVKQARAFVMAAGTYAFAVQSGDVVHVWTATP